METRAEIDPRVSYALQMLLGCDPGVMTSVRYAPPPDVVTEKALYIVPSGFFGDAYGGIATLPHLPLPQIADVPILFGEPVLERRGDALIVHADVIASAYFLLTRYEEWVRRDVRDAHGQLPGRESLPFRAGFLDRPIVDEYAALLRQWAGDIGIEIPPPQRKFSALLTHDLDTLGTGANWRQPFRSLASALLGHQDWHQAWQGAAIGCGLRRHPFDNLEEISQTDRQLTARVPSTRCRSIFFFIAGGNTPYDACAYRVSDARIRKRQQQLAEAGADIGLHASYEAGLNPGRVGIEHKP